MVELITLCLQNLVHDRMDHPVVGRSILSRAERLADNKSPRTFSLTTRRDSRFQPHFRFSGHNILAHELGVPPSTFSAAWSHFFRSSPHNFMQTLIFLSNFLSDGSKSCFLYLVHSGEMRQPQSGSTACQSKGTQRSRGNVGSAKRDEKGLQILRVSNLRKIKKAPDKRHAIKLVAFNLIFNWPWLELL